jgi:hypothetical protein
MLEGACKSLWERIGQEGRDASLRMHVNYCRRGYDGRDRMHARERMQIIVGEDRTGGTGCMLGNACEPSWKRIGWERQDTCLRNHRRRG